MHTKYGRNRRMKIMVLGAGTMGAGIVRMLPHPVSK